MVLGRSYSGSRGGVVRYGVIGWWYSSDVGESGAQWWDVGCSACVLLIAERDDDGKAGDDVMSPSAALHC
jgi:hypothetical protein